MTDNGSTFRFASPHSDERTAMLERRIHHYKWHRPHRASEQSPQ